MSPKTESTEVASYFERIADDFDSYYEKPANWFQDLTNRFLRKPRIVKRLKLSLAALDHEEYKKILDIGCGSGVLAIPLAERGHSIIGLDFSAPMIEIAKRKAQAANVTIDFRVGDFMHQKFSDLDACVALGVYEYFANPRGILYNMLATVRSGGLVVFDIPALINIHTPLRLPYLLWRKTKAYFYTPWGFKREVLAPFSGSIASTTIQKYGAGYLVILKKR